MFPIEVDILFDVRSDIPSKPDVEWRGGAQVLVSAAVSLFDYEDFIVPCLDSIAAQTHPTLELIVVDDASKDGSVDSAVGWMTTHADRFVRARLIRHRENQGLSAARNTAFAAAQAEQIMVIDADNTLYPRAIARLLETQLDAGSAVAYPQLVLFGDVAQLGFAATWAEERMGLANYIDAMALVSRAAWRTVGGYHHLDIGWEDYDFWCKFVEHGLVGVYVPEVLCRYRVHQASMLRSITNPRELRIRQRLMARHPWLNLGR